MKYIFKISVILLLCAMVTGDMVRPDDEVIAVKADQVETVAKGVIQNGIIIIRNGRIEAVGPDVKIPDGAEIIDASDKFVFPGLVNPLSRAGLSSSGYGSSSRVFIYTLEGNVEEIAPGDEIPEDAEIINPSDISLFPELTYILARSGFSSGGSNSNVHYRVIDELYPHQDIYKKILQAGFTTVALTPSGSSLAGQGTIVRPLGKSIEDMVVEESGLLLTTFRASSSSKSMLKSAFESGLKQAKSSDPKIIPLAAAAKGELPVFIRSNSPADTLHLLDVIKSFEKANITLLCGPENIHVAKKIAERKLPVLLPAMLNTVPYTKDLINIPATLTKAGIEVACYPVADSVAGHEDYLRQMAILVKAGLERNVALKAITLHPAKMLGLDYRLGSIEVGKDANLLILSGDVLDVDTKIQRIILEGKTVYSKPNEE